MGKKYMDTKRGSLEQSILDVWKESAELPEQPETEHGSGEHAFEVGTKRFDDYTRKITPGQLEEAFLLLDEQVDEEGVEFFTEEQWEIVEKLQDMTEEEHDALLDEMTEDQLEMYEGILGAIGRGIKKGAKRVFTKQGRADAKLKKAKKKEKLQQTKADTVGAKVKAKELKKSRKKQAADAGIGIRGKAIKGAKAAGRGAKKVAGAAKAGAKKVGAAIKKSAEDLEVPEGQEVVYEAKDSYTQINSLRDTIVSMWSEAASSAVDPKEREELDKAPEKTAKKMKRAAEPAPMVASEEVELDEKLSPGQKKLDVDKDGEIEGSDLAKLRKKAKKEGKDELEVAKEYKVASMKEALAKVWGLEEGGMKRMASGHGMKTFKPKPKEKKEGKKTDTGEDMAGVDLAPKIKEKK